MQHGSIEFITRYLLFNLVNEKQEETIRIAYDLHMAQSSINTSFLTAHSTKLTNIVSIF